MKRTPHLYLAIIAFLAVILGGGASASVSISADVAGQFIGVDIDSIPVSTYVNFHTGGGCTDITGLSYFDFGEGSGYQQIAGSPGHTYTRAGTFTAKYKKCCSGVCQEASMTIRVGTGTTTSTTVVITTTQPVTVPVTSSQGSTAQTGTSEFNNGNIYGVYNGPSQPTTVTFSTPVQILSVTNYHWNNGNGASSTGSIALQHEDGTMYGWWSTSGEPGMGGVPNAYWKASPSVTIKAGRYTVLDSNPSTWSQNSQSGNAGMTRIVYLPVSSAPVTTWITQVTTSPGQSVYDPEKAPDLVVTSVDGPVNARPGEKITIHDTVKNQGAGEMKSVYTLYFFSTNSRDSRGGTMLQGDQHTVSSLGAGASDSGSAAVTVPADISPGTYYLRVNVYAKPDANPVEDRDPWNNYLYAYSPVIISESGGAAASGSGTGSSAGTGSTGEQSPAKKFTSLDALAALQMSVEKRATDISYDLNKNGRIDSNDAREILRLAASQ
jgi:hypothetical protein